MKALFGLLFLATVTFNLEAQHQVIPLYSGPAPGSEAWNWQEKETNNNPMKMRIAYNVTTPTLTVFAADATTANGSAVIICPGGGYHVLNIEHEGENVAKALNKKGITAFVFKYRVAQSFTEDPWQEMMSIFRDTAVRGPRTRPVVRMAQQDIVVAMKYVRTNALKFSVDTNRIGIIGFSAGGSLARMMAHNYTAETKPAFAAVIYAGVNANANITVPADAPPLFIAAATDDILLPVMQNVELYKLWVGAKKSAELHLYSAGGHGLRAAPGNTWLYRFEDWMQAQGFLNQKK